MLSGRTVWLYTGTAVGMVVAFGRFLFSNIIIRSDFLWFVSAVFMLALITAFVLVLRRGK